MKIEELIKSSNKLGEEVAQFLKAIDAIYAEPLVISTEQGEIDSPTAFQRGAKIAELRNKLQSALIFWTIQTDTWRKSEAVKEIIAEYNLKHPENPIGIKGF